MQRVGEILFPGKVIFEYQLVIQYQMVSSEDIHTDNIMYALNMLSGIYKHTHRHTHL